MTATAHALVGGAIAASVKDPVLGITLSALSHPLLDLIPHWDFGWGWKKKSKLTLFVQASFDLILGVVLAYIFFGQGVNPWYFLACVFVSEVWDILEAPYWFFNWRFPPFSWIYNIQSKFQGRTKTMGMGILTQVVTISLLVLILQTFS
ncbi:hypothetical protein HYS97_03610 [Candidatus Daviesbacteria bacterium]|nr:hypothetical protein [Candidatus Daviesbacteria bacterium]